MRGLRWAIYLWPGLPDLWRHGAWSGLALATAFTLLASFILSATVVWDELVGPGRSSALWGGLAAGWLALLFVAKRSAPRTAVAAGGAASDLFPAALAEYLQGNWLDAELLARQQIDLIPSDVEASLVLAATLRHTNRFDEARETLDSASLWDRAAGWKLEIDSQYERLSAKENRLAEPAKPIQTGSSDSGEQTEHKVLENKESEISLPDWRQAA